MSSSNDPYKSRLFNFINRQTIRFQDKLGTTIRYVRSATEMSLQLLLYPVYLMVQSGRFARQQLESRVKSSLLLSGVKISKSDASITTSSVSLDEVLNLVEPWLAERKNSYSLDSETIDISVDESNELVDPWLNSQKRQKKTKKQKVISSQLENIETRFSPLSSQSSLNIQGIASLLDSHELVLVDYHNRSLNIFNSRQQQLLKQYIAKKQQKPNLVLTITHKVLASLPQISQNNSAKSSPVKFVWQILDWLQTSSVAKKVNLFGESKLPSAPVLPPSNINSSLSNLLVSLDNKLARIETSSLLSTSESGSYLGQPLSSPHIQVNQTQSQADLTSNPFRIRAIIKAAIDHFFGNNSPRVRNQIKASSQFTLPNSGSPIPLESKTASYYLPGNSLNPDLPTVDEQASWLSWNDIFSNTISSTVKPSSQNQSTNIPGYEAPQLLPFSEDFIEDFTSMTYSNTQGNQLETPSDLLETKATILGYEKHPLEKILQVLDRIIVWVEEKLLKIWQRFK